MCQLKKKNFLTRRKKNMAIKRKSGYQEKKFTFNVPEKNP